MKKAIGQTVRDIKRGVNKKVLKVPGIEQKVLDATSNEAWGPNGTLLADIAQATRNFYEYQIIMPALWKRIGDTGKNWRHVYKALIVLEYLVAHGSPRVIDEIMEHAYQISVISSPSILSQGYIIMSGDTFTYFVGIISLSYPQALAGFQYVDSSGRDQGIHVRKKSQILVVLVNDKGMLIEIRQKAEANRQKFRSSSTSGMDRPGSYGDICDDNSRANEDRYGRDGYRDDDYRRSQSSDEYQNGSRSRSSGGYRDRAYDDDGQYSSREHELKLPERNIVPPPSYEEATSDSRSPVQSERNGETASPSAGRASSPHVSNNSSPEAVTSNNDASSVKQGIEPVSAPADTWSVVEMDLLGSFSEPSSSNALAIMPVTPATTTEASSGPTNAATPSASSVPNQASENPFNTFDEAPFKATPSTSSEPQPQPSTSAAHLHPTMNQNGQQPQLGTPTSEVGTNFGFVESFSAIASSVPAVQTPTNSQFSPREPSTSQQDIDLLADILPPSGPQPLVASQPNTSYYGGFPSQASSVAPNMAPYTQIGPMQGSMALQTQNLPGIHLGSGNLHSPGGSVSSQYPTGSAAQFYGGNFLQQQGSPSALPNMSGTSSHFNSGNFLPQQGSQVGSPSSLQIVSVTAAQFNGGNFRQQQQQGSPIVGSQPALQTMNETVAQFNSSNYHQQQISPVVGSLPALQTMSGISAQFSGGNFHQQQGSPVLGSQPVLQNVNVTAAHFNGGNSLQRQGSQLGSPSSPQTMSSPAAQHNSHMQGNWQPQPGPNTQMASQPMYQSSTGSLATVAQPSREKFETKSMVWADTLSRGLVDLNISGSKTNPLADIGVDFEAINRKEKRMEKPAATTQVTSTVTMGKAMGSGSGMGHAGASVLRPSVNPMMGPGMGMGMGGGYGGMHQPMGGMVMGMNPGMGMNMRMGPMQSPNGLPPGPTIPGGYNPMMGPGGYAQPPYGGGYR